MPFYTALFTSFFSHVDKKLQFRLRLYILIAIAMVGIVVYDVFVSIIHISYALVFLTFGGMIGALTSRIFNISWNNQARKVMGELDIFGGVVLVVYMIFSLFRGHLVELFVRGPAIGAASFSILAGVMIGRVLGTRGKIIKVLKQQRVI